MLKDKLKVICVIYVVATMISSILSLLNGTPTATHFHLILRLLVIIIAVAPLSIFDLLKNQREIVRLAIHYLVTMLLIFALVWSIQIFESLHPNAYRDILLNYTGAYIAVGLVYYLYSKVGKSRLKGVKEDGSTGRDELVK